MVAGVVSSKYGDLSVRQTRHLAADTGRRGYTRPCIEYIAASMICKKYAKSGTIGGGRRAGVLAREQLLHGRLGGAGAVGRLTVAGEDGKQLAIGSLVQVGPAREQREQARVALLYRLQKRRVGLLGGLRRAGELEELGAGGRGLARRHR